MENYQDLNGNNSLENGFQTNSTFLLEPTLESELKKLLENKNKSRDLKFDKVSFLSKNIQSIGNNIPLAFCNITRLYLSNNNITSLEGIEQFANLTHFSISYNLIEDIYELNHIINPEILLHLNVKGNFFCKNPSFEEVILNLFPNLKTLDDLKINITHKKMIKYGQDLSKIIMIFLLDIDEKINKISMIKNVFNLNNEYNLINSSNNNLHQFNQENLNSLIEEFNNIDATPIQKILSIINEKRLVNNNNNNYLMPLNDLNNLILQYLNNTTNNLIASENNKTKELYANLFFSLILNQKRKDYRGFLNYLIMSSEPKLLEFIKKKGDNFLNYLENDKASINILCQNFEKILLQYSDYTIENINEIQMMIFYLYFNGNNILSNDESNVQIIIDILKKDEKIILNNYEQKVINFRNVIPDYFPIFPLDEEFMKNLMNLLKEKVNTFILYINELKNIKQNNKLNRQKEEERKNIINNIENTENYENNNIIEENNNENNDEIVNINNNNNNEIEDNNINNENQEINNSKENNDYDINNQESNDNLNQDNNEECNLNKPFVYNSQTDFYKNKNKVNERNNNINYIQQNNKNKSCDNKKNNLKQKKAEQKIKPNQEKIQMKYNIIQLSKILNNIIYNNNIYPKKFNFFLILKKNQISSKISQLNEVFQTIFLRHKLKLLFILMKKQTKLNKNKSRIKSKSKSKSKKKEMKQDEQYIEVNNENNKALLFHNNYLKKKFFITLKFNSFCKKEYLNKKNEIKFESIVNKSNDSINADIFNFFHGKEENSNLIEQKNNNNFDISEHNNSIKINDINIQSLENEEENKLKVDYTKDKNYKDALKLRKILDVKKDSTQEESNEEQNKYNLQKSKNEVDELLNNLKSLYKEIDSKTIKTNKSKKENKRNEYDKKNKEYIKKLKEVREKEKEKARKKYGKIKYDDKKLLGCPNFTKNTYSSVNKNIS